MLSLGIVGLPNVGKSTLFNALTKTKQAEAQNYPFCTIEPNVGIVEVPDKRLVKLAKVSQSKKVIPTAIEFVDIAGLVKGASEGEGLGNKFLSHIREVDAIIQVVRAFENTDITHVHNRIDPQSDLEIINLELIMADWQTVSRRLEKTKKIAKGAKAKELAVEIDLLIRLSQHLQAGRLARSLEINEEKDLEIIKDLHLLTFKPMLIVINTDKKDFKLDLDLKQIQIDVKLEEELLDLNEEEKQEYLQELGYQEDGLDRLIKSGYELLDLVTYFTSGEPETRAWTVKKNTQAPQAAGVIHTDFIKKFIKADVVSWQDFIKYNGWNGVKENGKLNLVGKDYLVQDGDVCYFHIGN